MLRVKVLDRETIKPTRPTPDHLRYLKYSLLDYECTPDFMPLIFFYSSYANTFTNVPYDSNLLNRLKRSLSETLSLFYPLAGRAENIDYLVCNDKGVPFVEAQVIGTRLEDLVNKAEVTQLDELVTSHGKGKPTNLLMTIQVSTFPCGGVAIGIKTSHVLVDAFSLSMFLKTWTEIARGKDPKSVTPRPFFDVWKVFPPPPNKASPLSNTAPHDDQTSTEIKYVSQVTKRFLFNEDKLNILRSKIYPPYIKQRLPSYSMVLSAFISNRIKAACTTAENSTLPYEVFHLVNIRPKLSLPKDDLYYFGNMIVYANAKPMATNVEDDYCLSCYDFLEQMRESIGLILQDDKFVKDLQEGREDLRYMAEYSEKVSRGEIFKLGFSNLSSGIPLYEADFGWGKPVWVTTAKFVYRNLVLLIPAQPSGKHLEAYISLSNEDMVKLENDQNFLSIISVGVATNTYSRL